jgi:hypothetical protein
MSLFEQFSVLERIVKLSKWHADKKIQYRNHERTRGMRTFRTRTNSQKLPQRA